METDMAIAAAPLYLDDLDLSRCIIGCDAVLDRSTNTLYDATHGGELRVIGTFASPAAALNALDDIAA